MVNINWQAVLWNLRRDYKSLHTISKEVGSNWQHLNRLARGELLQPKYLVAIKLLDLHFDYCRDLHNAKSIGV